MAPTTAAMSMACSISFLDEILSWLRDPGRYEGTRFLYYPGLLFNGEILVPVLQLSCWVNPQGWVK